MYQVEEYVSGDGKRPFAEWLLGIKDKTIQVKIERALTALFLEILVTIKALQMVMVFVKCANTAAVDIAFITKYLEIK